MVFVPNELSLHCPHCGRFTAVSPAPLSLLEGLRERRVDFGGEYPWYGFGGTRWWMGKCNACEYPMLVDNHRRDVLPAPQPAPVADEIPEPMNGDLREAKQCLAVGAYNAAVVMARRALQVACVEQGAPKGRRLVAQIRWLDENRKITEQQREWVDVARWVGNDGAHPVEPDWASGDPAIIGVSKEDAEDTIELVETLFHALYVAATRAQAQKAKRAR